MFDIESSFDQQLLESKGRPTVMFPEALDPRVLEAACHLARFARPVFLAPEAAVREAAQVHLGHLNPNRIEYSFSESTFINIEQQHSLLDEFAHVYREHIRSSGSEILLEEARRRVSVPTLFGICAVALGHADMVVGGAENQPKDYFRPMVKLLSGKDFACEAGVFVLPDEHPSEVYPSNIVVFGDVGVNACMTPEILAQVAVGTCAIARDLIPEDILPTIRAAIVSHSNHGGDEGPDVELVRKATQLVPRFLAERVSRGERYKSIQIEGEVRVNVALSQRSAAFYHSPENQWVGPANVIICPNLDMGNLLYHLYALRFPQAKKFPVMFGLRFCGVSLAMDCTPEDVRLGVKANLVRLHKYGKWTTTPKDTFSRRYRVLAINPGSTSTKIAVFDGDQEVFTKELAHSASDLAAFEGKPVVAQYEFRKSTIEQFLAQNGLSVTDLDAIVGRGGMLKPLRHGTYMVDEAVENDLRSAVMGEHASNLGGIIARQLVADTGKPAFIVDPPVVDEVPERSKITGIKAIRRKAISHALNQIATARRYAEEHETFYEQLNLIVCHMGGGISIGAHSKGRYIDVNNGLDGEGPFSPQRSGSLPVGQLIDLCFSGKYSKEDVQSLNKGRGGLIDLLGTADLVELGRRYQEDDSETVEVLDAMSYQIAKWIASLIPAFDGNPVDQILLTGGIARSRLMVQGIEHFLKGTGIPVTVYPGENEMAALAKGALRVLGGKETLGTYNP